MFNFLKKLRIKGQNPKNVFAWGCLHLCHDPNWDVPLWKMRGFDSAIDSYNKLMENACSVLNEDSTLFLLGDTAFSGEAEQRMSFFLEKIPFKECYIMPGNHTAGFSQLSEANNLAPVENFKGQDKAIYFIPNYFEVLMLDMGKLFVLSHYPILSWNEMSRGSIMLFSHVHGNLEKSELGKKYVEEMKCFEVSVEKTAFPVSFYDINKKLSERISVKVDHH
jgi:calcineurin-like phosphoesterase family protein